MKAFQRTLARQDRASGSDEELHLVRTKIIGAIFGSLTIAAPAALTIAIYRSVVIGVRDAVPVGLTCLIMYILALAKNRLSFRVKTISLITSITVTPLIVLVQRGLASPAAICFLVIAPSVAWILFGRRATLIVSAAIVACMSLIAGYTVSTSHLPAFDVLAYMLSSKAWISSIGMVCICGWLLFFVFTSYAEALAEEVRRHTVALEDANCRLIALSTTDGLTGLGNRRQFDSVFEGEWARCGRIRLPLTLIMLDVDYFKKYNDCYGHLTGDQCLIRIAAALQASARRATDLAARYGGEEFSLVLPGIDAVIAPRLAEALRSSIESLDITHEQAPSGKVTISIGVATMVPGAGQDATILLRAADEALYRAKNGGRNQVQVAPSRPDSPRAGYRVAKDFVQLAWQPAYESGHTQIDEEHRTLFGHAANLLAAVLSGRPESHVSVLLNVLAREVEQHFRNEEAILRAAGFPDAERHAEIHRELLARAESMIAAGPLAGSNLFQFLAEDLVATHILGADREYFAYLQDQGTPKESYAVSAAQD